MKVFQAISDVLAHEGVEILFALMGDANQNLIVDLAERHGVKIVNGRHEQNVMAMADGYTRFSDQKLGVATVTMGPGLCNTATSLVVARYHRSPVLLLAGAASQGDLHNPQLMDQQTFSALLAGASASVETATSIGEVLDGALSYLDSRSGPFVINLPGNIQNTELPAGWSFRPTHCRSLRTVPIESDLEIAAQTLLRARSPVILAGRGAVDSRAEEIIAELATYLQIPIATTLPSKGFCVDHSLHLGVSGGLGEGVALRLIQEACDCLLVVGASLNKWTTHQGDLVRDKAVIQIDVRRPALGLFEPPAIGLLGDARCTLELLLKKVRLIETSPRPPNHEIKELIGRGWAAHRAPIAYQTGSDGTIDPRQVIRELDGLLPEDRLVVAGGGHAGYLVCQYIRINSARNWNYTIDFGALGQGLGTAIGAAFARPKERVYHLTADGEFLMNLSDFHTAVNYKLPMTIVVLNDQGFGQERHDLAHKKLPTKYAMQPSPDFARLAEGFGGRGQRFDNPKSLDGLSAALTEAERFAGPTVFDIRINGSFEAEVSQEIAKALA